MGCSSCSSGGGLPGGCKNNGACGTYGCNKLDVFDWLSGISLPDGQKPFDVVEVRFKNSRKAFYRNTTGLELFTGDVIAVEASPGHDMGVVSLTGELVRMQMKRKEVKDNFELKKVYRKAKEEDIEKWQEASKLEQNTMMRARTISRELNLQMKISDVEYQGDKTKATFFYTADDRVDFRELIKRYADEFRVRVEMRQIGLRVEAGRLGGIGSCGRELCCSTWLTDFRAVSTSAARYQQLSLNPTKLAGQCGKLKCCLNYELDQYVEAFKDVPSVNVKLKLPKGMAFHFKTDIFKRTMFYFYEGQPGEDAVALSFDAVREIIEMNRKGIEISDVEDFRNEAVVEEETDFAQVVGQDALNRFDKKRGRGNGGSNNNRRRGQGGRNEGSGNRPAQAGGEGKPQQQGNNRPPQGRNQGPREGQAPRGDRKPQPQRPQGDRPVQGDRPKQERPQGDRQQGNNQRPPRPPRPEGAPKDNPPQKQGGNDKPREPRENNGNNNNRPRGNRPPRGPQQGKPNEGGKDKPASPNPPTTQS